MKIRFSGWFRICDPGHRQGYSFGHHVSKEYQPIMRLKEQADAAECRSRGNPLADCDRALRDF